MPVLPFVAFVAFHPLAVSNRPRNDVKFAWKVQRDVAERGWTRSRCRSADPVRAVWAWHSVTDGEWRIQSIRMSYYLLVVVVFFGLVDTYGLAPGPFGT